MLKRYFFSCQLSTGNLKKKKLHCDQTYSSASPATWQLCLFSSAPSSPPASASPSAQKQKHVRAEMFTGMIFGVRAAVYLLRHNDYGMQFISDRNYKNITIHFIAGALHTLHIHAVKCVLYALCLLPLNFSLILQQSHKILTILHHVPNCYLLFSPR